MMLEPFDKETKEEREQQHIVELIKENSIDTLELSLQHAVPSFYQSLEDALYYNWSVSHIRFTDGSDTIKRYSSNDQNNVPANGELGILLTKVFLKPACQIRKLTLSDEYLPSLMVPTMLWHFRNLQELVLTGGTAIIMMDWSHSHWLTLANALQNHPNLHAFKLLQHQQCGRGNNISDSIVDSEFLWATTNDVVALALATAPNLRLFVQEGNLEDENSVVADKKEDDNDVDMDEIEDDHIGDYVNEGNKEFSETYSNCTDGRIIGKSKRNEATRLGQKRNPSSLVGKLMRRRSVRRKQSAVQLSASSIVAMIRSDRLQVLEYNCLPLYQEDWAGVTAALESSSTLQTLSLSNTGLGDHEAIWIINGLRVSYNGPKAILNCSRKILR